MAEQKQPITGLGVDPTKVNPAEADPEKLAAYRQVLQEQVDALEQRYAQPNWFKVAAGFAKPQLGGFLASIGSASQALGENVEQQRAQQLPIAQMKAQIAQSEILMGQNVKQNEIFQQWRSSGKPMDADTYSRIMSLNPSSSVATAAGKFYEAARAGLDITTAATTAMAKDPMLQLDEFTKFQLRPDADPQKTAAAQTAYLNSLDASKPPQIEQAQWNAMSRAEKMDVVTRYANAQREAGMGAEATIQQQASNAPSRLSLLGSIRDLSLGVGLSDTVKKVDGRDVTVTGQQQMAQLLNYFGGNNPFEVLARAAADGKLGETLRDIDTYARQNAMSPQARDQFQKLSKLLAENQISLRNSTLNPTDASSMLQAAGSPNLGNSQTALVSLVDLLGHSEQNAIEKYRYVLDKRVPFRQLGVDPGYLQKQAQYAEEHRRIATSNPLVTTPSWYNPARSNRQEAAPAGATPVAGALAAPAAATPAAGAASGARRPPSVTLSDIEREIERRRGAQRQP